MIFKEESTSRSKIDCQKIDCSEQAFLLRRIPILQSIHNDLTEGLQQALSRLLKAPCLMTQKNLQSRFIDGYFQQLPASVSMNTFCVSPINGPVLLLLEDALVYHAVDRAFGGTGRAPAKVTRHALASTELAWMQSLLSEVCTQLQSAFKNAVPLYFTLEAGQIHPISAQAFPQKMLVVVCPFELSIENEIIGQLQFLWPYDWLAEIQDTKDHRLKSQKKKEAEHGFEKSLYEALGRVKIDAKARVGNKNTTLVEISRWKVGDTIAMDCSAHSTLVAESVPLFTGQLGNADDKYALKIVNKV